MVILLFLILLLLGCFVGFLWFSFRIVKKANVDQTQQLNIKAEINDLLYLWLQNKIDNKDLGTYFKTKKYSTIAIYGFGDLGERFLADIQSSNYPIEVSYIIDRNALNIDSSIKVISPHEVFEDVDVIVITPVQFYSSIKNELSERVNCPIVSLEDVMYELMLNGKEV